MTRSNAKSDEFPAELCAKDMAQVCGVSLRRLNQLAVEGVVKRASRGWYQSDGIASFINYKASQAEARADRRAAVTPLRTERALSLRLKNNAAEAELMPTTEAIETIQEIASDLCKTLSSVKAPSDLPSPTRHKFSAELADIVTSIEKRTEKVLAALKTGKNPLHHRNY
jgi:phage terminase Nu1 subunit (DNA packaging protein)